MAQEIILDKMKWNGKWGRTKVEGCQLWHELKNKAVFSSLVIIFVHYVARSFCETIKLPQEMPKMPKVEEFYRFY
jgi:hypothetical protein